MLLMPKGTFGKERAPVLFDLSCGFAAAPQAFDRAFTRAARREILRAAVFL